jgi:hypothetical protein
MRRFSLQCLALVDAASEVRRLQASRAFRRSASFRPGRPSKPRVAGSHPAPGARQFQSWRVGDISGRRNDWHGREHRAYDAVVAHCGGGKPACSVRCAPRCTTSRGGGRAIADDAAVPRGCRADHVGDVVRPKQYRGGRDGGRGPGHDAVEEVGQGVSARVRAPVLEPVPRTTLTLDEAAASLGVSLSHFRRHVLLELRIVYSGNVRLIPVAELYRWADKQARLAGAA